MKNNITYFFIIIIVFISGCSYDSYYAHLEDCECQSRMPYLSYYVVFSFKNDSTDAEYLMEISDISWELKEEFSDKMISKHLSGNGQLDIEMNEFQSSISDYKVVDSLLILDSINLLSTREILDLYFEDDIRLKTEILPNHRITEIIYVLAKRKEYISIYNSHGQPTKYNYDVFYGKIFHRNWDKTYKIIEKYITIDNDIK